MIQDAPGPEREAQILAAISAGNFEHEWAPIRSDARGVTATVYVSADAIKIDGVRVACTAATLQRIADIIGGSLQTTRVSDLAYDQATVRVEPKLQTPDAAMANWSRVVQHSQAIDVDVAGRTGLIRNVGKCWALSEHLKQRANAACNYGWYSHKAPYVTHSGERVYQPLGTAHNDSHVDYSQLATLMRDFVEIDGKPVSLDHVETDSSLSWLVNDGGIMATRRLPSVSPVDPHEVPRVKTPTDELSLCAILRDAHAGVFGVSPSPNRLAMSWAQCATENAHGAAIYNHNYGNVSAFSWDGDYYVFVVPEQKEPGRWVTTRMKFRSFADHIDGAKSYWHLFQGKFAPVLPYFDNGDPKGAAHVLKELVYYTADEKPYAANLSSLFSYAHVHVLPKL